MRAKLRTLVFASALALTACNDITPRKGLLLGAVTGVITAQMLEANDNWTVIAALAGAPIGTMAARNGRTHECACVHSRNTYRVGPCPTGHHPRHR